MDIDYKLKCLYLMKNIVQICVIVVFGTESKSQPKIICSAPIVRDYLMKCIMNTKTTRF